MADKKKEKAQKITGAEKKQRRLFKLRRAGVVLTRDEVKQIKAGRKKLRRDMRAQGIKSKKEFEITASSLGLYFDKNRFFALLWWWFRGKGLGILLGLGALALLSLYAFSLISQMRGHFTISMSDQMFREGFTLSETVGFENPTSHLFSSPAEGAPEISITWLPEDVDQIDGSHNGDYFAYTFYVRNEGENVQEVDWMLEISSESLRLSDATWAMIFLDGKMTFYAKADELGNPQMLPAMGDETRYYATAPFYDVAAKPEQFQVIRQIGDRNCWRLVPEPFVSPSVVAAGRISEFAPMDVHKITVVLWLEGDDPHCTNELIGGHLGLTFNLEMVE